MTYEVALAALGKDAANWDDTATVLTTEGATARGLTLTTADLSFAADWTGLTRTYSALQSKVAGLLEGGATDTTAIATTLRTVRKNYQENETQATESYKGTWDYT